MTAFLAKLRSRLTYANVMATLTAFAVLAGGTALAAHQLGKNSVGTNQLKANAVTTAKIQEERRHQGEDQERLGRQRQGPRRLARLGGPQPRRRALLAHSP